MDSFTMKAIGEEWARDRQQRRQEREMEIQHVTERRDTGLFAHALWARFSRRAGTWAWLPHQLRPGVG